ncbi:MAG: NAAT family transporter [Phycisphaeraceae bacterium]|nr:NAAT family transporter [Phycisphaeraceae bacterium]
MFNQFLHLYLKLFFILTPFLVLSTFLTWTSSYTIAQRHQLIRRTIGAIIVICLSLFMYGNYIFELMGITLDAFRVGAGILLLLSAISLVQGKEFYEVQNDMQDIAVVPLAIPVAVGPGTIGVLLVMGSELVTWPQRVMGGGALLAAIGSLAVLLFLGNTLEKKLGRKGLNVLSKLTGLILAALSVQIIMQGLKGFS